CNNLLVISHFIHKHIRKNFVLAQKRIKACFTIELYKKEGNMGSIRLVCPVDVLFSQSSIKGEFKDGRSFEDTLEDMLNDDLTPDDLPPIKVILSCGSYWAVDGNRRLYLYQILHSYGHIDKIKVKVCTNYNLHSLRRKLTTKNGGESIKVRGDPLMEWRLRMICLDLNRERVVLDDKWY
ncbi:unnamed protein product, partial [Owenia fusiformis]